jgi:hypothetical protein
MFYKINGNAGYGKTHELVNKVKSLTNSGERFVLVTPTNKAAMVLNSRLKKENLPEVAATLHSKIYRWTRTDKQKGVVQHRRIDPKTMKWEVDEHGDPIYHEEIQYVYVRTLRSELQDAIVLVDESSMVGSDVWYDLITSEIPAAIYAYGDEKQLPPIEKYEDLSAEHKPYYQFWHRYDNPSTLTTLQVNHRQDGDLKAFVDTIQRSLFGKNSRKEIPINLSIGDNLTIHSSDVSEHELVEIMNYVDIIITPSNKIRNLINIIARRALAVKAGKKFVPWPIVGDRIIYKDAKKITMGNEGNTWQVVDIAKNVTATIVTIHDICTVDNIMCVDIIDETGIRHDREIISICEMMNAKYNALAPRIDYAYGITVHSSQGGQWDKVLFLDTGWSPKMDPDKLRYVAVTRASKLVVAILGVSSKTEADAGNNLLIRANEYVVNQLKGNSK